MSSSEASLVFTSKNWTIAAKIRLVWWGFHVSSLFTTNSSDSCYWFQPVNKRSLIWKWRQVKVRHLSTWCTSLPCCNYVLLKNFPINAMLSWEEFQFWSTHAKLKCLSLSVFNGLEVKCIIKKREHRTIFNRWHFKEGRVFLREIKTTERYWLFVTELKFRTCLSRFARRTWRTVFVLCVTYHELKRFLQ